jgi:hypothetical protein
MTADQGWPGASDSASRTPIRQLLRTHGGAARILPGYLRAQPRRNGLMLSEYLALGLHKRPVSETRQFLGAYGAALLALKLNRLSNRRGLIADKLLFDALLRGAGLPAMECRAVFGRPAPPGVLWLANVEDLRRFVAKAEPEQLFGKPVSGQRSQDIVAIQSYDAATDAVITPHGQRIKVAALWAQLDQHHRGTGYMFQTLLQQHPDIAGVVGPTVATVRLITFQWKARVHILNAFWKIPRGTAMADNMWRGNLMAPVDAQTGRVGGAIDRLGVGATAIGSHPDTGAQLQGRVLPDWTEAVNTVKQAAGLIHVIPLVGWDVALGQQGPIIIEANSSPSLELPQYLSGQGVLAGDTGTLLRQALDQHDAAAKARRRAKRARRRKLLRGRLGRD